MNDPFFREGPEWGSGQDINLGIKESEAVTTDRIPPLPRENRLFLRILSEGKIFRVMPGFLQGRRNTAPSLNTTR